MLLIALAFLAVILFVAYHMVRFRNPYKLYMVFGKKGSGKTTLMTKLALAYQKKGWKVYCDREVPGCITNTGHHARALCAAVVLARKGDL